MPLRKKNDYIPIKCEGWSGKFVVHKGEVSNISKAAKFNENISHSSDFYGFCTEPEEPTITWSGKFKPGEVFQKPVRNYSDDSEYYKYNTEPTVLPPEWDGKFELDPDNVRIKPERNSSDVRDYAEAKRFHEVK